MDLKFELMSAHIKKTTSSHKLMQTLDAVKCYKLYRLDSTYVNASVIDENYCNDTHNQTLVVVIVLISCDYHTSMNENATSEQAA